jgi:hypothetical protein
MNLRIINAAIGLTVVLAALLLAFFIALTDQLPGLFGWKRWLLVGVLVSYSLFRVYRSIRILKNKDHAN